MAWGAAEPQTTRLVGAPLVGALHKGTHEGCPYETRKLFAKKNKNLRNCDAALFFSEKNYSAVRMGD
jgi:hypothetical protein